jgi:hypothetical protein
MTEIAIRCQAPDQESAVRFEEWLEKGMLPRRV